MIINFHSDNRSTHFKALLSTILVFSSNRHVSIYLKTKSKVKSKTMGGRIPQTPSFFLIVIQKRRSWAMGGSLFPKT